MRQKTSARDNQLCQTTINLAGPSLAFQKATTNRRPNPAVTHDWLKQKPIEPIQRSAYTNRQPEETMGQAARERATQAEPLEKEHAKERLPWQVSQLHYRSKSRGTVDQRVPGGSPDQMTFLPP
jgi:hypothetical protein